MDYQKKKLLTQSVGYLQAHLQLTSEFLTALKDDILTAEEVSTVQVGNNVRQQQHATTSG